MRITKVLCIGTRTTHSAALSPPRPPGSAARNRASELKGLGRRRHVCGVEGLLIFLREAFPEFAWRLTSQPAKKPAEVCRVLKIDCIGDLRNRHLGVRQQALGFEQQSLANPFPRLTPATFVHGFSQALRGNLEQLCVCADRLRGAKILPRARDEIRA
jgi:hypothetical protein